MKTTSFYVNYEYHPQCILKILNPSNEANPNTSEIVVHRVKVDEQKMEFADLREDFDGAQALATDVTDEFLKRFSVGDREDFHLIIRLHYPGMDMDVAARSVELFAERVMPALKGG